MTPERVTVAASDLQTLTGAELFGALAHAGLTRRRLVSALQALQDPDGDPAEGLAGMRFLQAAALALALRNSQDPGNPTWEDAQRWDVVADLSTGPDDPLAEDRRDYRVAAAIATGLPPDVAEGLPVTEVEAFAQRRAGVGLMAGPALIISIVGDASKLASTLGQADNKVQAFGKSIDLGMVAKVGAAAGVVGIATTALLGMAKAAGEDRAEAAKLDQVIKSAGAATGDYTAQVDAAIAAGQARAFTDTQTREALQSLVTATGSVSESTALLTTAQDVARFAGVDLATAADAVAKAQAGQDMQLARLIPGLTKGATATDTIANASKIAAGQADKFANSTEGQMARSSDAMAELGETIGSAVLPILDALLPALIPIIQALGKLVTAILPVAIPLIKTVAAALAAMAEVIAKVANFLADMIEKFTKGLDVVKNFVDHLPSIPNISLPFAAVPTGAGVSATGVGATRAGSSGGRSGGVTVNIYGGDPTRVEAAVAKALRGYTRRNGTVGLAGMTGR